MKKTALAVFFILQSAVTEEDNLPFESQRAKRTSFSILIKTNAAGIKKIHRAREFGLANLMWGRCRPLGDQSASYTTEAVKSLLAPVAPAVCRSSLCRGADGGLPLSKRLQESTSHLTFSFIYRILYSILL